MGKMRSEKGGGFFPTRLKGTRFTDADVEKIRKLYSLVTCDGCGIEVLHGDEKTLPEGWRLVVGPDNDRCGYCPKCATAMEPLPSQS